MVRKTKAFQFIQPEGTDRYNIEDQNHNWDQVEKFFKESGDGISSIFFLLLV